MATENLYAPPGAAVDDVVGDAAVQPVRLWPPSGRIGRVRLLGYLMALNLIAVLGLFVVLMIVGAAAGAGGSVGFGWIVLGLLYLAYVVAGISFFVQRSHDMDLSGWSVVLTILPFVNLYWVFKGGTPGTNRFGAPPPPNSIGVIVLAWTLVVVPFLFGLLGAIAVPAYQQYLQRANARSVQSPTP